MNEDLCKQWAREPRNGSLMHPWRDRCIQAAEWALAQYKLREQETNALLERNGQLKKDARYAATTINRLQVRIQELEAQLERANIRA